MTGDLPGYVLVERIGSGAASVLWRGHPTDEPGRPVAVKRIGATGDPHAVARARREAEALAAISHPGVVGVLDVVPDGEGVALVLPYLPGGSLAQRLAGQGSLPPHEVAAIGAVVADALAAAHTSGVLHRDVKPTNILFDAAGRPVLSDFDVARLTHADRLTARGHAVGTAEYLDPAVAAGAEPDVRSDVYALGVVCYEALTGAPPYAGSSPLATLRSADRGLHVPVAEAAPETPPSLTLAVERAIARDPAERFPSAAAFAQALGETAGPPIGAVRGEPVERSVTRLFGPRPPRSQPATPTAPRPRWPLVIAAAVALLVLPVAMVAWLRGETAPTTANEPVAARTDAPVVSPPPPCEDTPPPSPPSEGRVLTGDLAGGGCSTYVVWTGQRLEVPQGPGQPARLYELGAPGDVAVLGDWDCDGRDTPALYRPSTGEVFVFDGFAGPGGELESRPAIPTGRRAGHPVVVDADGDGCGEVAVTYPGT